MWLCINNQTRISVYACGFLLFIHWDTYFAESSRLQEILKYFRGSELQNYFTCILEDTLKVLSKLDCVLLCVCLFLFMIHYYLFDGVIISRFRGLTHTLNVHFDWSTSIDFTSDSKCTYSCIIFILIMFTCQQSMF